jgi:hypothetical protein
VDTVNAFDAADQLVRMVDLALGVDDASDADVSIECHDSDVKALYTQRPK